MFTRRGHEYPALSIKSMRTLDMMMDACNLTGVLYDIQPIIDDVCEQANILGKNTEWRNGHPAFVLIADKINGLALANSSAAIDCYSDWLRPGLSIPSAK